MDHHITFVVTPTLRELLVYFAQKRV